MKHRRKLVTVVLVGTLLPVIGLVALSLASRGIPDDVGQVDGRLQPCPPTPNCECSEAGGSVEPLSFEGDAAEAFRSLLAILGDEPRAERVRADDTYAHFVFTTPLLRFRDDLEVRLDTAGGVIHVRSASRVGRSDLGANRARIESLRERWGSR